MYYLILLIIVLDFVWSQYLSYRNRKQMTPLIPKPLDVIYDQEIYSKQQSYQKENSKIGFISSSFSFVLLIVILLCHGFGWLDNEIRNYVSSPVVITLLFFGVIFIITQILSLPFSYYDTFVIEEKYGFNKSTKKVFWLDAFKSLVLGVVFGGLILSVLVWFYNNYGDLAWLYAWGSVSLFSLLITFFYSNLIVPLFNKQSPLEEGELKHAINEFSERAGFEVSNIYVIDASKRSTKANAYFTGFGRKKRIVLFDTLIQDLSTNEIVAVLAHEIGHYKKKHTLWQMIFSILNTGFILFILSFFLNNEDIALALGTSIPSFHIGVLAFTFLFTPISSITGIFINMMSRKNEYQADAYATSFGLGNELISGLKKLSVKSLSNLNPDPLNVFVYYSHPTLLQRINKISSTK